MGTRNAQYSNVIIRGRQIDKCQAVAFLSSAYRALGLLLASGSRVTPPEIGQLSRKPG